MHMRCFNLLIALCIGFTTALAVAQTKRVMQGNLVIEGIPDIPAAITERLRQYHHTRSAYLNGWLPTGDGILITTRFGETRQLHLVREPGGTRQQLTFFDEPVRGAAPNPNPAANGLLFRKDTGGSEFYQLFFFDLATGTHRRLTDGTSRHGAARWSNKGDRFVFYSTKRNGKDWDLYLSDTIEPDNAEPILTQAGTWVASDWSPDDTTLLMKRYVSINESYLYALTLATGELRPLNPTDEQIAYGWGQFAKNGAGVYFTSNQGSPFMRLRFYDFATDQVRVLTETLPWDVEGFDLSDDGHYLAFVANEDGISTLHVRRLPSMRALKLPPIPVGQIYALHFSSDNTRLGMVLNTSQTPGDVYALDLKQGELIRWTYSETGGLNRDNFVVPTLIRYPTFDQVEGKPRLIPSFYYRPKGPGPFPVLIQIHGGPEGQARPYFSAMAQYYVNELGLAVLRPNVRGSRGYGKTYLLLDNGTKREDAVKDIGALLDWIVQQPELDSERVAVIGGSYGSYMVLASMVHYGERLRAGIDNVGISNFVTFLENTQAYRRDLRRVEYGDERDPVMREFLLRISPTTHAERITKPLFVAQGLNDPRVPASESEQMVEAIRRQGGTVWYLLANNEGHGFRKKSNRRYYHSAVVVFLERFLLDKP